MPMNMKDDTFCARLFYMKPLPMYQEVQAMYWCVSLVRIVFPSVGESERPRRFNALWKSVSSAL